MNVPHVVLKPVHHPLFLENSNQIRKVSPREAFMGKTSSMGGHLIFLGL